MKSLPNLARSKELLARASKCEAALAFRPGVLSTGYGQDTEYPVFVARASGPYIWDVDGNRFIDFILAFGCIVLGHADEAVTSAVIDEIRRGVSPTLTSVAQVELAELLTSVIPGMESVFFLKTGSDATAAAVRLARAFTGRKRVLNWGYNGWHDWCATRPTGLIPEARDYTTTFSYNRLGELEDRFAREPDGIACVIMMPFEVEVPAPGFLQSVRELAHRYGALFILDEVRSGFRLALGGAQEHFGVRADVVTLSKAMANGHPISAVGGRRDVLDTLARISCSSVFFRSSDGFAAALATVKRLQENDIFGTLWRLGNQFMSGLDRAIERVGISAKTVGLPPAPFLEFCYSSAEKNQRAMQWFCARMLAHGVLLHPTHHWFTCAAMTAADIDQAVACAEEALRETLREFQSS